MTTIINIGIKPNCYLYEEKLGFAGEVPHVWFMFQRCQQIVYSDHTISAMDHAVVFTVRQQCKRQAVTVVVRTA